MQYRVARLQEISRITIDFHPESKATHFKMLYIPKKKMISGHNGKLYANIRQSPPFYDIPVKKTGLAFE